MSEFSTNERAEQLMGRRLTPEQDAHGGVMAIDYPVELGFQCPVHKRTMADEADHPLLQWSEYNAFVWCPECDRDWPSALCVPINAVPDRGWVNAGPDAAINVYLDTVADACNRALHEVDA